MPRSGEGGLDEGRLPAQDSLICQMLLWGRTRRRETWETYNRGKDRMRPGEVIS